MEWFPQVFATALGVQLFSQLLKTVFYSIRDRRFTPSYFVSAGGIPSAHAAFVAALSVAIGVRNGFASDLFAVAAVFSAIVIYDAYRLRGHVQHHARIINERILEPTGEQPISEMVGHSLPQIIAGMVLGGGVSLFVTLLLS